MKNLQSPEEAAIRSLETSIDELRSELSHWLLRITEAVEEMVDNTGGMVSDTSTMASTLTELAGLVEHRRPRRRGLRKRRAK
jgi:hypothetical protein